MKVVEALKQAHIEGYALPAFNIFNYLSAESVINAANEEKRPIIIQTSVGTVKKFGIEKLFRMLDPLIEASGQNVFLNLDHCTSVELAKECVDAGWDMVMFDGSKLPFEENVYKSREVVAYASERGVAVEAELGVIAGVEEEVTAKYGDEVSLEMCRTFIKESGAHIFAPSVGTVHGVYKGIPHLNFELVKELANTDDTPIVIHGGTGLSEENFKNFVRNGASKINISTALKHAYIDAMKSYLKRCPDEYNPIKLENYLSEEIKNTAEKHIRMFTA